MDTQVQVSNSSTTTISGYGVDRGGPHHPSAYDDSTPLLNRQQHRGTTPLPPSGSGDLTDHLPSLQTQFLLFSVRGHRDVGKDVVTAVTHHDINGMNSVSTVAVKDVDVQMTSLSGYETYV